MTDNLTKTLIQRLEEYFGAKIAEGYQIVDRESTIKLRKMVMEDFKLKKGNWTYTGQALKTVMERTGLKVPDDMSTKLIEEMKINLIRSETPIPQATPVEPTHDTLPRAEAQPTSSTHAASLAQSAAKIVTEDMRASWERGLKMGLDKLMYFYARIGAIEVVDIEPEKKKMTLAYYQKQTDDLAHDCVTYCKENNVHLSKFFELAMLVLVAIVTFVLPPLNLLIFGKRGKKPEAVKELGKDDKKG